MKKLLVMLLVVALLSSLSFMTAFAAEEDTAIGTDSLIAEAQANEAILVAGDSVYDFRKLPSKTFSPERLDNQGFTATAALSLNFYANCELGSVNSRAWSDAVNGSSAYPIDRIMATARFYKNSVLASSATDNQMNSSHAGAGVESRHAIWEDPDLYGSHAFEEAGYQSWYPETYDG